MQKSELGTTGAMISGIGYGGMPLSIQGRPPETLGRKVIHAAIDCGINFIDTADVYCLTDDDIGHNERLIAEALAERRGEEIFVATKGGLRRPNGDWTRDASPRHLREACEQSLRSLRVEQIFLYQLHAPDPNVPFMASIEALAELQQKGKIRHIGLSNVTVEQIRSAQSVIDLVAVQNRLSPFFREALETEVVAECERQSITFLAYSPVGGGRLQKKLPAIPAVKRIAANRGVSPHAVVLAWVRAQGERVVPIPGASKVENVVDSAGAAALALTREEISAITAEEFSTR